MIKSMFLAIFNLLLDFVGIGHVEIVFVVLSFVECRVSHLVVVCTSARDLIHMYSA